MDDMPAFYPPPGVVPVRLNRLPPWQTEPIAAPLLPPRYPSPGSPNGELRTLFVAGLPDDVKSREVYNLFRGFPGYESSQLGGSAKKSLPFAFAVFRDQQSAAAAMHALNGVLFDPEKGCSLHIDFAKANSRSKRSRTDDERFGMDKKPRISPAFVFTDPGLSSTHLPGISISTYGTIGYSPALRHANSDVGGLNDGSEVKMSTVPPCPTLFVANLGPRTKEQEHELSEVFSRCPGFLKFKMQNSHGTGLVAFVDFKDTECSTAALNLLQGTVLQSSPTGESLRLEYAKSRMGTSKKSK